MEVLSLNSATCFYQRSNFNDAVKYVEIAHKLNEKNPKILYRYAKILQKKGKYDEAKEKFQMAIKLTPNDSYVREEYLKCIEEKKTKEIEHF